MLTIFVRFTRHVGADIEIAEDAFAHLEFSPELQLLEQFKAELYAEQKLRGFWTTLHSQICPKAKAEATETQYVWVKFTWNRTLRQFTELLQKCFDEGMNGWWEIIDAVDEVTGTMPLEEIQAACANLC